MRSVRMRQCRRHVCKNFASHIWDARAFERSLNRKTAPRCEIRPTVMGHGLCALASEPAAYYNKNYSNNTHCAISTDTHSPTRRAYTLTIIATSAPIIVWTTNLFTSTDQHRFVVVCLAGFCCRWWWGCLSVAAVVLLFLHIFEKLNWLIEFM